VGSPKGSRARSRVDGNVFPIVNLHDGLNRPAGWHSGFPQFSTAEPRIVRTSLEAFVRDAGESQIRAWAESIPAVQREVAETLSADKRAATFTAILEYQLPLEARRPDVVFLVNGGAVVLELKGKPTVSQADLDQVSAYARDLRAYHRECHTRAVHPVVVPMRRTAPAALQDGVWVTPPLGLDSLVKQLTRNELEPPVSEAAFLADDAYCPLPTLVQAARELFESGSLRRVWRAHAATDPAVQRIAEIAHHAAATRTRHLIMVSGTPGSGKTLVGMRTVHAHFLDDLAVSRGKVKPTVPAIYLSGNGPLVTVLQHVLRTPGGGGKTFVRGLKDYLDRYAPRPDRIPDEHVVVFDEAQRAFTPEMVRALHPQWPAGSWRSEPSHFVEIAERIPEWACVVGLIGGGQEINIGEEAGLLQWREALDNCRNPGQWTVHAPAEMEHNFAGGRARVLRASELNLNTELRFHGAIDLGELVARLLDETAETATLAVADSSARGSSVWTHGLKLWATRDLEVAKNYLRERYRDDPGARYGIVASARDKLLVEFGIPNDWHSTKRMKLGPWFSEGIADLNSCRHLDSCVTEFQVQGLELDMALLAWGSDLIRVDGKWDDSRARKYKKKGEAQVLDPFRLRVNAYRVLLTRGRDGTVVFVPPTELFDETWRHLLGRGFRPLSTDEVEA